MSDQDESLAAEDPDSDAELEGGKKVAVWQNFGEDEIREVAKELVHFSVKTVNSNAAACGVRLGPDAGLTLPYVSARTLMGQGVVLDLDYISNSGRTATIVKQINAVQRCDSFSDAATPVERNAIAVAVASARETQAVVGDDAVDARVRQLLIPRFLEDGSVECYVSMSPMTAGGVCQLMLGAATGLAPLHNEARKEERKKGGSLRKRIGQAKYGIGGSNPQNVGGLVRSMQRPLFVQGPTTSSSARAAFGIYYRGIEIGVDRRILVEYRDFRAAFESDGRIGVEHREAEREFFARLAAGVLATGATALDVLASYEDTLPREHLLPGSVSGEFEMVSRKVSPVVRGLIDPRLRKADHTRLTAGTSFEWPRKAAQAIVTAINKSLITLAGERVAMTPLDGAAQSSVVAMIEEALR